MESGKPYKLWIGGRNVGYANFLNYLAKTGMIKPIELSKPKDVPISWTVDEFKREKNKGTMT
jgi:hypothetical protein